MNLSWTKRRQRRRTPISEVDSKNQYGANCNLLTLTFKTNFKSLRKSLQWSTNLTIRYTLILGRGDVWESNFFLHLYTSRIALLPKLEIFISLLEHGSGLWKSVEKETFWFRSRLIPFIQLAYYASISNKQNCMNQ